MVIRDILILFENRFLKEIKQKRPNIDQLNLIKYPHSWIYVHLVYAQHIKRQRILLSNPFHEVSHLSIMRKLLEAVRWNIPLT